VTYLAWNTSEGCGKLFAEHKDYIGCFPQTIAQVLRNRTFSQAANLSVGRGSLNRVLPLAQSALTQAALLTRIRFWLVLFIVGLVLSGITAFPLQRELVLLNHLMGVPLMAQAGEPALHTWLRRVLDAVTATNRDYPFLAYGTDWLAFGHLVIAVAFLGPLRDPVRNRWVLKFGLIACAGVVPLALIAGTVRGIPVYWRPIDCSFGVVGAIPLLLCLLWTGRLERAVSWSRTAAG